MNVNLGPVLDNFIAELLQSGLYQSQSEVVREALRRMEREESSYLNPPPLTEQQLRDLHIKVRPSDSIRPA